MDQPEYALYGLFQALLLNPQPDFKQYRKEVEQALDSATAIPLSKCRVLERAGNVFEAFSNGAAGKRDLAIIIRQVNRLFEHYLEIPSALWEVLEPVADSISLQVKPTGKSNILHLIAKSWIPSWLSEHARGIDTLVSRRSSTAVLADGNLYSMMGHKTYKSDAQRTAVNVAMYAPPGSTTLITLPTGEGKSMCILLPAWIESNAGRRDNGTTIVVVPTISLAQDQTVSARNWFSNATLPPSALTSFTSPEQKKKLYRGVRDGSLPILYTSPEALLMNSWLYEACQQSASAGKLTRFVVDEAHLVDTWGAEFRPEFQLLGAFCTQLRQRTNGQLVTLLLSATVTQETEQVLRQTFTPDGELQTVFGNRLRPEPSYWFSHVNTLGEQQQRVLDALNHLPRPAILYVTIKKDAVDWQILLKRHGYKRVRVYTGDTKGNERADILKGWRNNQIDIIIGNSAFGVGVDKADIRTIIHATIPDNMDRYYQEVGRGGRDGNNSISLVVTKSLDLKQAKRNKAKLIGEEIGWNRWQGMWRNREGVSGDEFILSMTVPPIDKPTMGNNTKNRQWNQRTLLLLQRCGLLAIVDSTPLRHMQAVETNLYGLEEELYVQVRIKNEIALCDEELFKQALTQQRKKESDAANLQIEMFASTVRKMNECIGRSLAMLYPYTTYLCGGCPVCRMREEEPFLKKPIHLCLEIEPWENPYRLSSGLVSALGERDIALVLCESKNPDEWLEKLMPSMVESGIEQIVISDMADILQQDGIDEMFKKLSRPNNRYKKHRLVSLTSLLNSEDELFGLPTAIFYSNDNAEIEKLFLMIEQEFNQFKTSYPILHVIPNSAELSSYGGLMRDKINGTRVTVKELLKQLSSTKTRESYR